MRWEVRGLYGTSRSRHRAQVENTVAPRQFADRVELCIMLYELVPVADIRVMLLAHLVVGGFTPAPTTLCPSSISLFFQAREKWVQISRFPAG
jgi:hypothetical protein